MFGMWVPFVVRVYCVVHSNIYSTLGSTHTVLRLCRVKGSKRVCSNSFEYFVILIRIVRFVKHIKKSHMLYVSIRYAYGWLGTLLYLANRYKELHKEEITGEIPWIIKRAVSAKRQLGARATGQ